MSDDINENRTENPTAHVPLTSHLFAAALVATEPFAAPAHPALAQRPGAANPNILVIFGDDVGQSNISAYTRGLVGYKTPNIDRIANEGMMFTDYMRRTAARRAARLSSRPVCLRTGLCKVVFPAPRSDCRIAI